MITAGLIGIAIGLVLGMTGAGGSVVAVPLLMGGLGYGFSTATGVSLGAVALSAMTGVLLRWRSGALMWRLVFLLALGGALLSPLGQWLAARLDTTFLLFSFALLMLYMAWRLWTQAVEHPEQSRIVRAATRDENSADMVCSLSASGYFEWRWPCVLRLFLVGALAGLLTGLYGVGGGFVIVPLLVLLTGLNMAQAVATSLAVITLVAGSTFLWFVQSASLPSGFQAVSTGAVLGMLLGSAIASRMAGPKLQKLFSILIVVLAVYVVLKPFVLGG